MADAEPIAEPNSQRKRLWSYARVLAAPLLLWGLVLVALREPLQTWLDGEKGYDEAVLREWLDEARGSRGTLREMVEDYLDRAQEYVKLARGAPPQNNRDDDRAIVKLRESLAVRHEEIFEQLQTIGSPPTKRYSGQLPLFPTIYRLQVRFHLDGSSLAELSTIQVGDQGFPLDAPITWDSGLPSD